MGEKRIEFKVRVAPYSDGSGYAALATVDETDEGVGLRIEVVTRITFEQWLELKGEIDTMFQAAMRPTTARGG